MKKKKKFDFLTTIGAVKYIVKQITKQKKGKIYIIGKMVLSVFNAFFPFVFVVFPGLIINELMNESKINSLVLYVVLLSVTPFIQSVINHFLGKKLYNMSLYIMNSIEAEFYHYTMSMDYDTLEIPDIQIQKNRADETIHEIITTVDQLSGLITALISLILVISIISILNPVVIAVISFFIFINSYVIKKTNRKDYLLRKELTKHALLESAYSYMMDKIEYAKEIRLFKIQSLLVNSYLGNKNKYNDVEEKIYINKSNQTVATTLTSLIQQALTYAYLIYNVAVLGMPIGTMTIFLNAIGQFSDKLSKVVRSYLNISKNNEKTNEFIMFMNLPSKQHTSGNRTPEFDDNSIIEFIDVSFIYPGSETYAIKKLNLKIIGKERLCIVGENGSGKSTFIKLLLRLYAPTEGRILLNGINIYEYDYELYQQLFVPVFQDYAHLLMTIKNNIVLSNTYEKQKLDTITYECGLAPLINKLDKGYDTQVGKWIDEEGFNPSGGEGQKMAIARAIYHGGSIYILDEPTAALDPNSEYEVYAQFNNMVNNKCAIFVTHRLSAVQLADKVAVFDDGQIIEYGTHAELYTKGGKYKEMFDKQAEFYVNANLDDKDNAPINPTSNNE